MRCFKGAEENSCPVCVNCVLYPRCPGEQSCFETRIN